MARFIPLSNLRNIEGASKIRSANYEHRSTLVNSLVNDFAEKKSGGIISPVFPDSYFERWRINDRGKKYRFRFNMIQDSAYGPLPSNYFYTLESNSDPVKYIEYLSLAESAHIPAYHPYFTIIQRNYFYSNLNPQLMTQFLIQLSRFYEVIMYRYLKTAFNILDISRIEDLEYAKNAYSTILNRIVPEIERAVNISNNVSVNYGTFSKAYELKIRDIFVPNETIVPEILKPYSYETYISDKNIFPIKNIAPLTYFNEQSIKYPSLVQDAIFTKVKGIRTKEAILGLTQNALQVIAMNITKLEGRIAQLSDPGSKLTRTEAQTDPFQNPFLVYNAQKSDAAGEPIYENLAVNKSFSVKDLEQYYTSPLVSTKYMNQAEDIRNLYMRKYQTESGGTISEREIQEIAGIDKKKKSNLLPILGAGAATAFIAWQATQ